MIILSLLSLFVPIPDLSLEYRIYVNVLQILINRTDIVVHSVTDHHHYLHYQIFVIAWTYGRLLFKDYFRETCVKLEKLFCKRILSSFGPKLQKTWMLRCSFKSHFLNLSDFQVRHFQIILTLFNLVVASNILLFYFVDGPKLTDRNFSQFKTLDLLLWWRSVGD